MHIPRPNSASKSGLSVLLGAREQHARLVEVPTDRVVRNEAQPRTQFNADAIAALAESIAASGIIQPIAVRELSDGRFEIVAGERRWLAAQRAGLRALPALVHDVDERESLVLALAENLVREDLNPLETARAYAALLDEFEMSVADLARAVGRSRPAVSNTLRLLELPDDVLTAIERGDLSEGHGRALLQLDDRLAQRRCARAAIDQGLSVRALEAMVREAATRPPSTQTPRSKWNRDASDELQDLVARLTEHLGDVRLKVKVGERGGKLELHCPNEGALVAVVEELDRALATVA